MKTHECEEQYWCDCDIQALEPRETCPVHGYGKWPPRCYICGRFMKWGHVDFPDLYEAMEAFENELNN